MIKQILIATTLIFATSLNAEVSDNYSTFGIGSDTITPLKETIHFESDYAEVNIPTLESVYIYAASCGMMVQHVLDIIKNKKVDIELSESDIEHLDSLVAISDAYNEMSNMVWVKLPKNAFGGMDEETTRMDAVIQMMFLAQQQRNAIADLCIVNFMNFAKIELQLAEGKL